MVEKPVLKLNILGDDYRIPLSYGNVALWDRYIPYKFSYGFFGEIVDIYGYNQNSLLEVRTLSNIIRLESLYNNLSSVIRRSESLGASEFKAAECGVGYFKSFMLIVSLVDRSSILSKELLAFDTFEGLPFSEHNPCLEDKVGTFKKSLESFNNKFSQYKYIKPIKGLVQNTLDENDKNTYDFVHIDLDLYEGIQASLLHFYPRLKKHGIIQIDDYNISPWEGANDAVDEFLLNIDQNEIFFNQLSQGGAYIIKL